MIKFIKNILDFMGLLFLVRHIKFHLINYEDEYLYLKHFLKKYDVLVDIGANRGIYTYLFSIIKPKKTILAFEPNPFLCKFLNKRFSNKGVLIFNYGIGNKEGVSTLWTPKNFPFSGRSSLIKRNTVEFNNELSHVKIKTKPMDDFIYKHTQVDSRIFIKIDVEGYEYFVLNAFNKNVLNQYKIDFMIEICASFLPKSHLKKMFEFFSKNKYSMYQLDPVKNILRLKVFKKFSSFEAFIIKQNNENKVNFFFLSNYEL